MDDVAGQRDDRVQVAPGGHQQLQLHPGDDDDHVGHGRIDKTFLQQNITFDQPFYVCGPDEFTQHILAALQEFGCLSRYSCF